MKKIIVIVFIVVGIIGCGTVCPSLPPKRAIMHEIGGMGMQYHFTLYDPSEGAPHSVSLKCPQIEYLPFHLYTNTLGEVTSDAIIWVDYNGFVNPLAEAMTESTTFTFLNDSVIIKGMSGRFSIFDGVYQIEHTPPESWGVKIATP